MLPALIRFIPRPGLRVNARECSYIIGVLDVAGYEVRGVVPDDAIDFRIALDTMRITRRDSLLLRASETEPPHEHTVFVRVGDTCDRPPISVVVAPGLGTESEPIEHNNDSIATTRAILRAAPIPDKASPVSA